MDASKKIEIQLSKSKLTLTGLGSLVFVGIGIWFVVDPPKISNPVFGDPTTLFIAGLASMVSSDLQAFSFEKTRRQITWRCNLG